MHYVTAKGILSANNRMNLYRGCSHGCIYCDSRSNCYHMEHAFEDIEVKENAIELLEKALKHKRKKCMIGTGAMTDPYMHLFHKKCEQYGIIHNNEQIFSYLQNFEVKDAEKQLSLLDIFEDLF